MHSDVELFDFMQAELGEWVAQIDVFVTEYQGAVMVADRGGEVRFFVRLHEKGIAVTRAERAEDEALQLIAREPADVVRYLTVVLGQSIRVSRGLSLSTLHLPSLLSNIAEGASLEPVPSTKPSGSPLLALTIAGSPKALFPAFNEPFDAVEFSHYADQPIQLIRDSLLDPQGAPLFARELPETVTTFGRSR